MTKSDAEATYAKTADIPKTYPTKEQINGLSKQYQNFFLHKFYTPNASGITYSNGDGVYEMDAYWHYEDVSQGYMDLMDGNITFPSVIEFDSNGSVDYDDKVVLSQSKQAGIKRMILKENDRFFINGRRLLTDLDADTFAKKSDIPKNYVTGATYDSAGYRGTTPLTVSSDGKIQFDGKALLSDIMSKVSFFNVKGSSENEKGILYKNMSQDQWGFYRPDEVAMQCVVDMKDSGLSLSDITYDSKKSPYIFMKYNDDYYINGHKLAFAD